MSSLMSKFRKLYPPGRLAAVVVAFSIAETASLAFSVARYWSAAGIPWHGQVLFHLLAALSIAVGGWLLYWLASGMRALIPQLYSSRLGSLLLCIVLAMTAALYAVSWAYFWRTSMFLDAAAVEFAVRNAGMMREYFWQVERTPTLILIVTSGVAVFAIIRYAYRRLLSSDSSASSFHFTRGLVAFALAANLGMLTTYYYGDPPEGPAVSKEWWRDQRPGRNFELSRRVSPLLTMVASAVHSSRNRVEGKLTPGELGPLRLSQYQSSTPKPAKRPSVILIAVESLRSDMLEYSHQGREVLPHINKLCRTGRRFTRAYAQSSHSNYADPALFSSLYPLRTRYHHYYSRADPWPKTLLYDVLKPAGYATALYSSQNEGWGNMDAFLESPNLDVFFDSRSYDGPTSVADADIGFSRFAKGAKVAGKMDDEVTMDLAIDWCKQRADAPFCLCLNFQSSHFPYQLAAGAPRPFQPCELDFEATFTQYPKEKTPIVRNAYMNALHYIDSQIGKLVSHLESSGRLNDTIIVIAGDNGECFYENGYPTHAGLPFEPAVNVGLVMHCPTLIEPGREAYLTQMIDVAPTILACLKLPPHPGFQGSDVLASDRAPSEERAAFIHCCAALAEADAVIVGSGWKLVHDRRSGTRRLYDLNRDPRESRDLSADRRDLVLKLSDLLDEWGRRQLLYYQTPDLYAAYFPPLAPCPPKELSADPR